MEEPQPPQCSYDVFDFNAGDNVCEVGGQPHAALEAAAASAAEVASATPPATDPASSPGYTSAEVAGAAFRKSALGVSLVANTFFRIRSWPGPMVLLLLLSTL